jgi:RraA family protein
MDRSDTMDSQAAAFAGVPPRVGGSANNQHPMMDSHSPTSAEIHPGVGFRIKRDFVRPKCDVAGMFEDFGVADISDHLNRLYAVDYSIKCLSGDNRRLVGPACTVKVYPGDNLMVHKVLDIAKPGDVVVVDAHGSTSTAVLGDTISMKARHRGIAGVVVDGYVRDLREIQKLEYPVYARGDMPIGPLHRAPGEINYPICCGGVVVTPGDIIIADRSGIVVLPQTCIEDLYVQLRRYKDRLAMYLDNVRKGKFSNAWVDELLSNGQCPIEA